ncbi:mitotic checkpoint regulator, MAD2B-interacting-domain-containing protein [Xylariales sp. PMI_506]|nr:mitotic checkpoint regulator, MAD2B-interacting-domain-containing protein [Xylariales sp. PMI_506]
MGLVDYSDSDSESDSEPVAPPVVAKLPSTTPAKKAVQKVVDRSNPRKIVVNLGSSASAQEDQGAKTTSDEPPAKRARTGGGAFSGFASLLPAPKNKANKPGIASGNATSSPRPGINLKTGAAPGFSRSAEDHEGGEESSNRSEAASNKQPSIPEGQKPAEEVKLVGKPLMFKPLSVSRKPAKKNGTKSIGTPKLPAAAVETPTPAGAPAISSEATAKLPPPKKKVSLFSIGAEHEETVPSATSSSGAYEPLINQEPSTSTGIDDFAAYDAQYSSAYGQPVADATSTSIQHFAQSSSNNSLATIATDMNLSAAARRELFGRRGAPASSQSATQVINFNTDQEYAHNEELRAAGEQQIYNPVRAIAPGKHNLRQLVTQVHNQRDALEESFAKGKSNRNEAGAKYGWR